MEACFPTTIAPQPWQPHPAISSTSQIRTHRSRTCRFSREPDRNAPPLSHTVHQIGEEEFAGKRQQPPSLHLRSQGRKEEGAANPNSGEREYFAPRVSI